MTSRAARLPDAAPAAQARRALIGVGLWVVLDALSGLLARPPAAQGIDAGELEFSASRALATMAELCAGLGPRPMGSADGRELCARLEAHLRWLDYRTEVQEQTILGPEGSLGRPRNLIAWGGGREDLPGVLVVAHYDSVAAGVGASDDLAGVGALCEMARALAAERRSGRRVVFLFTDGEESGLFGAAAFARHHPWMERIETVLNLEARGTSGPSYLFETGEDDAHLIGLYAGAVERPNASSLSVALYRRMPNDTDFTVFRERGLPGANFAFIGDVAAYHTDRDRLERLDPASLQHQGDQALALLRALRADETPARAPGRAPDGVHLTLLGRWLVRYPASWTFPLGLAALLLGAAGASRAVRAGAARWGGVALGIVGAGAVLALGGLAVNGLVALLREASGDLAPWRASDWGARAAFLGLALAVAAFVAGLGRRWAGGVELHLGATLAWGFAALASGVLARGASPLVAGPALVLALLSLAVRLVDAVPARFARIGLCALVPAVLAFGPIREGVWTAFGPAGGALTAATDLGLATLLVPLFAFAPAALRTFVIATGIALLSVGGGATLVLPHRSPRQPARLNVVYELQREAGATTDRAEASEAPAPAAAPAGTAAAEAGPLRPEAIAFWSVEGTATLPSALARLATFQASPHLQRFEYRAPAPVLDLPGASFELVSQRIDDQGLREVRGRLVPSEDALWVRLAVVGSITVESLVIDGVAVPGNGVRAHGLREPVAVLLRLGGPTFRVVTDPAGEHRLERLDDAQRAAGLVGGDCRLVLTERRSALPPEGEALRAARPSDYAPFQMGDGTLVTTIVALEALSDE